MTTVQSRKNKGKRLQNKIVEILKNKFNLTDDDIRPVPASVNGIDVILTEKTRTFFNWDIEIKNQEKISIWAALKQCVNNCSSGKPLLIFSRNREAIYVCMKLEDFLDLYKSQV